MLEQLLIYLHNWFRVRDRMDGKHPGTYKVENGGIALPFLHSGQYFRIVGSTFNDGLYIYGDTILNENREQADLTDETFDGSVWALAVPKVVIDLADEVAAWQEKYGDVTASPYTSESFGGYSYSKAGSAGSGTGAAGWEAAFRSRLNRWRKMRED